MELSDKEWEVINPCFLHSHQAFEEDLGVIIEKYWKEFSGYFEQEHLGGIYP